MGAKNNKRELILTAALDIFLEKGYHNSTSEEIAKRAGVAKGTLYQYFSSKQEIFLEMHQLYAEQYIEKINNCIDMDYSFEDNLRRIVHFHLNNIQDIMHYSMRLLPELISLPLDKEQGHGMMQHIKNEVDLVLGRLIAIGQQRGELKAIDSHMIIYCITGIFMGAAQMLAQHNYSKEEKVQLENELVQSILHGIAQ